MEKAPKKVNVSDPKSIELSSEMKEKLKKMKEDHQLSNMDQVIRMIWEKAKGLRQADRGAPPHDNAMEEVDDDDGKFFLPQSIFASQVRKNHDALRYYTGLTPLVYDWVQKELSKSVRFCPILRSSCQGTLCLFVPPVYVPSDVSYAILSSGTTNTGKMLVDEENQILGVDCSILMIVFCSF
jgi:hypothetical protein